ncbi:MAG: hypothetical protein ACTSPI_00915 [Candidatus Heimdallarchaeaceae archaeon]
MKYFTKEYIELCKDERIQRLKKRLRYGDWYIPNIPKECSGEVTLNPTPNVIGSWDLETTVSNNRRNIIWLPTGEQLDEEIIKIVSTSFDVYRCAYSCSEIMEKYSWHVQGVGEVTIKYTYKNKNPLVGKIKLLKKLKEEESEEK